MSLSAQEEADRLFSQHERVTAHPEDANHTESPAESDQETTDTYVHSDGDTDDDDRKPRSKHSDSMATTTTTYHLPPTLFDANTGPKGVIADAQSFDRAKKRSFRRTLMNFANSQTFSRSKSPEKEKVTVGASDNSTSDEDEEFMRHWRANRIQEMTAGQRRQSPSKRKYGSLDAVDAHGYLDAVEKVPADTVVVVCIYDPESNESAMVEDSLMTIARRNVTTRFVKLHHEIAEMDHVGVPAILAYRGGDVFATLVDIDRQLPACNSTTLGDLLRQQSILLD